MQPGSYDQILTKGLLEQLKQLGDPRLFSLAAIDPENAHDALAQYLEHALANCLAMYRGKEQAEQQQRLVSKIIETIEVELDLTQQGQLSIASPLQRLLAVHSRDTEQSQIRPDTPLARCALLTGTRLDPSLAGQLQKELATASRVDILCSFIKWSGLRLILDDLRQLASKAPLDRPRIRVVTTSYMGATDARAIEELSCLPNTQIRVSYDTARTRLHAKSYLFHRETGFGSAYVGSANLSKAALSEGLEWTTKISQYELPYLWNKLTATFDIYWGDDEFQHYDPASPARLREALRAERASSATAELGITFDLRPFPFQEEILDILSSERQVQNKYRHLIVAATGTGKTMIAAFDYARRCKAAGKRVSLLFVAHREEILRQALGTFRGVLRDQNFGDLLIAGSQPDQSEHLFCSIQSYNSREMWDQPKNLFRYVVVDEFHHAAAPSYQRLLENIEPEILLGLTATPERSDGLNVFQWFCGQASATIRLPDAINRRLLCPFQYFGISDSVDLNALTWQRGGYRIDELDEVYTGNDVRAMLILQKVRDIVLHASHVRGLGFCVSVAHANFMGRFFLEHGVPSAALTAHSTEEHRKQVREQLRTRAINFLFVVDLYNEGVDIPEIDTVLFLRPTESLTVYLQQFGRGLRLHDEKECLTVLDFIGAQRAEFRFAARFRSLSARPELRLNEEIENGFPHLPSGCSINLERVAQRHILENIRSSIGLNHLRLQTAIRELSQILRRTPNLPEALDYLDITLDGLLRRGLWSRLLAEAGQCPPPEGPDEEQLAKGIRRLSHVNSHDQIAAWSDFLKQLEKPHDLVAGRRIEMLMLSLWGGQGKGWTLESAIERLRRNSAAWNDLKAVLDFRRIAAGKVGPAQVPFPAWPLTLHADYTRDEILVALGYWTMAKRPSQREGVLHLKTEKLDVFFVTLQKTEADYSPTTMYEDYFVGHDLFHWQSQSTTSTESNTGQRYIHHEQSGYTPLLFVRETQQLPSGLSSPYTFMGPCHYVSHQGSRPMSIVWKLQFSVPARLYRKMALETAG